MPRSHFDALGGEAKLRPIIDVFVDRVFDDVMIGFFFRKTDKDRLKELEYQHAARLLGADVPYQGRNLREAHHQHAIMGGQFARRKQILSEVLAEAGVPLEVRRHWLEQTEKLRSLITRDLGSDCDPKGALDKVGR